MKKHLILSAACLSASLLSVQAQTYFQDNFNRADTTSGIGSPWTVGNTSAPSITGQEVAYASSNMNPAVVGVDLSSESIGQEFKISVEFEFSDYTFSGLWFLGSDASSGYVVRVRTDGLVQFLDYNGGVSVSNSLWAGSGDFGSAPDNVRHRLTITSTSGTFVAKVENLDTDTVLGSFTGTRTGGASYTGKMFGLYQAGPATQINDNFLVAIPEPGAFALIFGTLAGAMVLVRRRR